MRVVTLSLSLQLAGAFLLRSKSQQGSHHAPDGPVRLSRGTTTLALSSSKEEHATFETNKRIESRLKNIEREGAGLLTGYYEPHLASFSVRPGGGSRISVTSS